MNPPPDPRPESLLVEQDWVRPLVQRLVRDEARAEDVLQATWLRALHRPPRAEPGGASWKSWLARVARHLALRDGARESSRRRREERAARGERLPSTAEIVEREEERRRIVEHVLALSEPYRTTLILRFYEGLEPREIAREQGTNASTVRNRIARGLGLLRERLERERGSRWLASCLAVLPLGSTHALVVHASLASWLAKGGIVAKKIEIVAAAVIVATAGVAWLCWPKPEPARVAQRVEAGGGVLDPAPAEPLAGAASAGTASTLENDAGALEAARSGASRKPAGAGANGVAADDGLARLFGQVVDAQGQPLAGTQFVFETSDGADGGVPIVSDLPIASREVVENPSATQKGNFEEQKERRRALQIVISAVRTDEMVMRQASARKLALDMSEEKADRISTNGTELTALQFLSNRLSFGGAQLLLVDSEGNTRDASTGSEGNYSIEGLHPGTWKVFVSAEGRLAKRTEVEIAPGVHVKRLDLSLGDPLRVRVKLLTPDGRDLAAAIAADPELSWRVELIPVALRPGSAARFLPRGGGNGRGHGCGTYTPRAELSEEERSAHPDVSGVLTVSEEPPLEVGLALSGALIERRPLAAGQDEVEFRLSLDDLRRCFPTVVVRLVDAQTHRPVTKAGVTIEGVSTRVDADSAGIASFANEAETDERRAALALEKFAFDRKLAEDKKLAADRSSQGIPGSPVDANGDVRIPWVPCGEHTLFVLAPGYGPLQTRVLIEAGNVCELAPIELSGLARVSGRIFDADGQPMQVSFSLLPSERFEETHEALAGAPWASDEHGAFDVKWIRREHYVVRVDNGEQMLPPLVVDASQGEAVDLELHLVHSTPVRVLFNREPPEDAALRVFSAAGVPVLERDLKGVQPADLALAPGSYLAEVRAGAQRVGSARFTVAKEKVDVKLALP